MNAIRAQARVGVAYNADWKRVASLAKRVEELARPSRSIDVEIFLALSALPRDQLFVKLAKGMVNVKDAAPFFTSNLNAPRHLGGLLVFASDIGADGLAMVKLVFDTTTTPVVEHTGIHSRLHLAWLVAALKGLSHGK